MDNTKADILNAALHCARRHGLYDMTRAQVAREAGTGNGTVSFHFHDMNGLRTEVIKASIKTGKFLDVLAQALTRKDYHAVRAPADVKRAALETLA